MHFDNWANVIVSLSVRANEFIMNSVGVLAHRLSLSLSHSPYPSDDTNRLNGTIDAMSSDMHWMKNAIVEWMQAMEHGNRTNELIEKYCKSDQKRADALDLRRCKLQTNILNNVTLLNELCEEQASLEQMLDRTAQLYRQSHLDRRDMVETWRGTAAAMNSRDNSIRVTNEVSALARSIQLFCLIPFHTAKHSENCRDISADD